MITPEDLKAWKDRATIYAQSYFEMTPFDRQAHERVLLLITEVERLRKMEAWHQKVLLAAGEVISDHQLEGAFRQVYHQGNPEIDEDLTPADIAAIDDAATHVRPRFFAERFGKKEDQ